MPKYSAASPAPIKAAPAIRKNGVLLIGSPEVSFEVRSNPAARQMPDRTNKLRNDLPNIDIFFAAKSRQSRAGFHHIAPRLATRRVVDSLFVPEPPPPTGPAT